MASAFQELWEAGCASGEGGRPHGLLCTSPAQQGTQGGPGAHGMVLGEQTLFLTCSVPSSAQLCGDLSDSGGALAMGQVQGCPVASSHEHREFAQGEGRGSGW